MFCLKILQAGKGDSFVIEYGNEAKPKFLLIDGGELNTFKKSLAYEVEEIKKRGCINRVIISHVCDDHINGIVELFTDIRNQLIKKEKPITIEGVWLNQFSRTIDKDGKITQKLAFLKEKMPSVYSGPIISQLNYSIKSANTLVDIFAEHGVPVNRESKDGIILADNFKSPIIDENVSIMVLGPTIKTIKKLQKEWNKWITAQKKGGNYSNMFLQAMSDNSYRNLSSIIVLLESESKKILMTGDSRGDHLIENLQQRRLLSKCRPFHVDVLKLPHHGSMNNVSEDFFRLITADKYVVSAKNDKPHYETLQWIAESAKERGEEVTLIFTNNNRDIERFRMKFDPNEYNYKIKILNPRKRSERLEIL